MANQIRHRNLIQQSKGKTGIKQIILIMLSSTEHWGVGVVSIAVIVSMLDLWAEGPRIDTKSGTFNGNHYVNGLREIYDTRWTNLALSVVLFTA